MAMTTFFYYITAINAITFLVYGIDKYKAKRGKWRVPESTLLWLALIGGSIGAYLGMRMWHLRLCTVNSNTGFPSSLSFMYFFCMP